MSETTIPAAASTAGAGADANAAETDRLDVGAAVILGIAAVAIAWSGFQSSGWGGANNAGLIESIRVQNDALDEYQQADAQTAFDHAVFVEIVASDACDPMGAHPQPEQCEVLLTSLSPEGREAVDRWLERGDGAPFRNDAAYLDPLYENADGLAEQSSDLIGQAAEAGEMGQEYGFASTMLATVLFFGGLSVVLGNARLRTMLLIVAGVMLAASLAYLATLPVA
ncbi:MAG: hypothetical protein AAGD35_14995 [Actinomycetota bacterium]